MAKDPAVVLVAVLALELVGLEVFGRRAALWSNDIRTMLTQLSAAERLQPLDGKPNVLIVGNSLLSAVHFDELNREPAPRWNTSRISVTATGYYDWYYCVRSLLQKGSRPDQIVILLNVRQLIDKFSRGDFSAHYLISLKDSIRLAHQTGLHPTETASLILAHMSRFWGTRAELRKGIYLKTIPLMADVRVLLLSKPRPLPSATMIYEHSRLHLAKLRELADTFGTKVVIVLAPSRDEDNSQIVQQAGQDVGLEVLVPVRTGTWPAMDFPDGVHLAEYRHSEFTRQFSNLLSAELEPRRSSPQVPLGDASSVALRQH